MHTSEEDKENNKSNADDQVTENVTERKIIMRSKQSVVDELNEKKAEKSKTERELAQHESVLKPRTEPLESKMAELKQAKENIVTPKTSPLFTVFAVLFAVLSIVNFAYIKIKYVSIVALAAMGIVLIIKHFVQKNMEKPVAERRMKIDSQISELCNEISKIEEIDPQIALLRNRIDTIDSEISKLTVEFKNIAISEKVGTNCLIVSTNNRNASYSYVNADAKLITVNRYIPYIKVDGQDRGTVASPVSIIPLSPGLHSFTIEFDPNADGTTFTTHPYQFTLNDSIKYYSFKDMKYICAGKDKGFTFNGASYSDLDSFLSHAEIDKSEFERFIGGL